MEKKESKNIYADTGLSSNMEDYIETIWILSKKNKVVRVKDIAKSLEIKMPSVTAALNKLKDMELIDYEKYGFIELTDKGKSMAQRVYNRHECLYEFFHNVLNLDEKSADAEACKVEHVLTPETCKKLSRLVSFYSNENKKASPWIKELARELKSV